MIMQTQHGQIQII